MVKLTLLVFLSTFSLADEYIVLQNSLKSEEKTAEKKYFQIINPDQVVEQNGFYFGIENGCKYNLEYTSFFDKKSFISKKVSFLKFDVEYAIPKMKYKIEVEDVEHKYLSHDFFVFYAGLTESDFRSYKMKSSIIIDGKIFFYRDFQHIEIPSMRVLAVSTERKNVWHTIVVSYEPKNKIIAYKTAFSIKIQEHDENSQ